MFSLPVPFVSTLPEEATNDVSTSDEGGCDNNGNGDNSVNNSHHTAPAGGTTVAIAIDQSANDDNDDDDLAEISPTALANAEHLDRLEASDAIDDIASFQDVELPRDDDAPPRATDGGGGRPPSDPDGIRRAKRYYYCLPVVTQYRIPIAGCCLVFALLVAAISLSAESLRRNRGAIADAKMAGSEGGGGDRGETIINDAPPEYDVPDDDDWGEQDWYAQSWEQGPDSKMGGDEELGEPEEATVTYPPTDAPREGPTWSHSSGGWQTSQGGGEEESGAKPMATDPPPESPGAGGDEELGDPLTFTATDPTTDAPREGGDEELGDPLETAVTDPPTDAPRETPVPSAPAADDPAPVSAAPQWYLTDGEVYETFLAEHESDHEAMGVDTDGMHSHLLAGIFCQAKGMFLCGYDDYCPDGRGSDPYKGAPNAAAHWNAIDSLEQVEWAPFYAAETNPSEGGGHWVQVGSVPRDEEGSEDNDFGRCWTWDQWNPGGVDIEAETGEDHRRWILCCQRGGGGWDEDDRSRI